MNCARGFTTYWRSAVAKRATLIGLSLGFAFGLFLLATERVLGGATGKGLFLVIAMVLGIPALAAAVGANSIGFAIWNTKSLREGPRRLALVLIGAAGVASSTYVYATTRWSRLDAEAIMNISVKAWLIWMFAIVITAALAAAIRWISEGFKN